MSSEATSVPATGSIVAGELAAATGGAVAPGPATATAPARTLGGPLRSSDRSELLKSRWATTASALGLSFMVFASIVLVSLAASRASFLSPPSHAEFPSWMSGPLGSLASWFEPGRNTLKLTFTFAVAGMYIAYLIVLACAPALRARWAIATVVVLHVIFFLAPPLSLTDVFNYINYGRMEIVHGLNPYTTIPSLEPHTDPSFLISNWHHLLSPYGPLFTIFSFALVPLGVATSFWVLKGVLMLASLAGLWLVWKCAELLGRDPLAATLFVGLNPLVLVWGLGGDHNDFLMVLCLLLAFYLLLRARAERIGLPVPAASSAARIVPAGARRAALRRLVALIDGAPRPLPAGEAGPWRELAAGFALVAAVAIKASAAILLPVVLLGVARRLRLLSGMAIGAIVLGGATLFAFGPHLPNLGEQSKLVTAVGLPNLLGFVLGSGGETTALKSVLGILLIVAVAASAAWAWRSRNWIAASGFATLALLLTLSWTLPWYVLWLLPLAALARTPVLRTAALVFSVYLMLAWVPVMTDIIHALGFKPSTTKLGQLHQAQTKALLH
jgi:hypothetical protein